MRRSIALQIGYASEFSFAKAFKRTFGIAPGTYRGQRHGVPGLGRGVGMHRVDGRLELIGT